MLFLKNNETKKLAIALKDKLSIKSIESSQIDTKLYQKITDSGVSSQLFNGMQHLPQALSAMELSKSFQVIMPEGINGVLMQYKNGMLGTPVVSNGKIVAHAGLQSLKPAAVALSVFTVASVITGQYFMAQINKKLKAISFSIEGICKFLENDKLSQIQAHFEFLDFAESNNNSIIKNDEQKISTIINIQNSKIKATELTSFYSRQLKDCLDTINIEKRKEVKKDKSEDIYKKHQKSLECLSCYYFSLKLLATASILEISYTQNIEKSFLDYIYNNLEIKVKEFEKVSKEAREIINSYLSNANNLNVNEIKYLVLKVYSCLPLNSLNCVDVEILREIKMNKKECEKQKLIDEAFNQIEEYDSPEAFDSFLTTIKNINQVNNDYTEIVCIDNSIFIKTNSEVK